MRLFALSPSRMHYNWILGFICSFCGFFRSFSRFKSFSFGNRTTSFFFFSCRQYSPIFSVAKWVQRCKGHATGILCGRYLTPAVVLVSYHYLIAAVNQTGDISEVIIQIEVIRLSIYSQHEWLSLRIIYIIRVPCTASPFGEHITLRQN